MAEPSADAFVENPRAHELRTQLGQTRMETSRIIQILRKTYDPKTEQEAVSFLKPRVAHFGVADLLDSPYAQLSHTNGKWTVSNPVADLLLDPQDDLRFTGTCHQIQPAVYSYLVAVNPELQQLKPFREWVSFNKERRADYYHYYVGTVTPSTRGFKPSTNHDLDPSVFYTRLFSSCTGASDHQFREDLAGLRNYTYFLSGENPLGDNRVPYNEVITNNGVDLLSVGLIDAEGKSQAIITLNKLLRSNTAAPDTTMEFAFDLAHPETVSASIQEKFATFKGYSAGSEFSQKLNISLTDVSSDDRLLIENTRNRFIQQIRRLSSLSSFSTQ